MRKRHAFGHPGWRASQLCEMRSANLPAIPEIFGRSPSAILSGQEQGGHRARWHRSVRLGV
jgi:hypothetical protein